MLPATPVVSRSTTSSTPAGAQTEERADNLTSVSSISITANIRSLPDPVTPGPPGHLPQEADTEGSKAEIHSRELEGNHQAKMPELPENNSVPTPGNATPGLSEPNVAHSVGENASREVSHHATEGELLNSLGTQHVDSPESKQSKVSVSTLLLPTPTPQTRGKSAEQRVLPSEKPSTDSKEKKQECNCQQDATLQLPAEAQRRLGASQQKNLGVFVSTPRTEEAKWALASLIFLFALLTFSVLYTQIYKKFRKSHSLYWTSETHSEEKESVASKYYIESFFCIGYKKSKPF